MYTWERKAMKRKKHQLKLHVSEKMTQQTLQNSKWQQLRWLLHGRNSKKMETAEIGPTKSKHLVRKNADIKFRNLSKLSTAGMFSSRKEGFAWSSPPCWIGLCLYRCYLLFWLEQPLRWLDVYITQSNSKPLHPSILHQAHQRLNDFEFQFLKFILQILLNCT